MVSLDGVVDGDEGGSPNRSECSSPEVTLITSAYSPLARINCGAPSNCERVFYFQEEEKKQTLVSTGCV